MTFFKVLPLSLAFLTATVGHAENEVAPGKIISFGAPNAFFGKVVEVTSAGGIVYRHAKPVLSLRGKLEWKLGNALSTLSGVPVAVEGMTPHGNNCGPVRQSSVPEFTVCAGQTVDLQGRKLEVLKIFTDGLIVFEMNGAISAGSDLGFEPSL